MRPMLTITADRVREIEMYLQGWLDANRFGMDDAEVSVVVSSTHPDEGMMTIKATAESFFHRTKAKASLIIPFKGPAHRFRLVPYLLAKSLEEKLQESASGWVDDAVASIVGGG